MRYLGFEIRWEIDNRDGFERASKHLLENRPTKGRSGSDFFTQIPQPIQRNSEMKAILSLDLTSIHSFPEDN